MGVLEAVRRHGGYVAAALFLAVAVLLFSTFRAPPPPNAYFTIDGGATYFVAPLQVPPFSYQGKEAVQALLFTADGGATTFVGYLLRYTPDGKMKMKARLSDPKTPTGPIPPEWTEVKRPGSDSWVKGVALFSGPPAAQSSGATYGEIVDVTGPNKKPAFPVGAD